MITEKLIFRMPVDYEYQFPAMAAMQSMVNSFVSNTQGRDVTGGREKYELFYDVDIPEEDWCFFQKAGLQLSISRSKIKNPTMLIDLSDARIDKFKDRGCHVAQVCEILSGAALKVSIPVLRQAKPKVDGYLWAWVGRLLDCEIISRLANAGQYTLEDLLRLQDGELTGVVGYVGRETYLAAAMGLLVVEIVTDERPRNWLSKYVNAGYRVVDVELQKRPMAIAAAVKSAEQEIASRVKTKSTVEGGK